MTPATLAARAELARLYAAPSLDDGDLARLPVLVAFVIPEDSGFSQAAMFDGDGCESGYCFV